LTCTGLWIERRTCPRAAGATVAGTPVGVECVRLAYADDVPLLVDPEDTRLSSVRRTWGKSPVTHVERTDRGPRSCDNPRRLPPTPWTRVPSTAAATGTGEDRSSSFPVPASRSRRPHVAHRLGTSVLIGPCKHRPGVLRPRAGLRESDAPCDYPRLVMNPPPPDDVSEPAWLGPGGLGES